MVLKCVYIGTYLTRALKPKWARNGPDRDTQAWTQKDTGQPQFNVHFNVEPNFSGPRGPPRKNPHSDSCISYMYQARYNVTSQPANNKERPKNTEESSSPNRNNATLAFCNHHPTLVIPNSHRSTGHFRSCSEPVPLCNFQQNPGRAPPRPFWNAQPGIGRWYTLHSSVVFPEPSVWVSI